MFDVARLRGRQLRANARLDVYKKAILVTKLKRTAVMEVQQLLKEPSLKMAHRGRKDRVTQPPTARAPRTQPKIARTTRRTVEMWRGTKHALRRDELSIVDNMASRFLIDFGESMVSHV